jgi:predicted DNA-binding transcriptional regulator AlpA
MSADRLNQALEETIRDIAGAVLDELLPPAIARQLRTAERAETEEEREMRSICAQEYLTKREAARFFNVSESHIDNLIADDSTFPVHRIGVKNVRLRRVELIEWSREQGRRRLRRAG